jgi:hypothetical protein
MTATRSLRGRTFQAQRDPTCNFTRALGALYPRVRNDAARHPKALLNSLPTELWLEIASHIGPVDYISLRLSCKSFWFLFDEYYDIYFEHRDMLLRRLRRDWIVSPAEQLCILCMKPHTRLLAQPRTGTRLVSCTQDRHSPCTSGLHITTDYILCQLCWTELLLHRIYRPYYYKLEGSSHSDWQHTWQTEWRSCNLLLKVQSIISPTINEKNYLILPNWPDFPPMLVKQLTGVNTCGCPSAEYSVLQALVWKLSNHFHRSWKRLLTIWFKGEYTCCYCGAVYITEIHGSSTITVTRYHNLSSAMVFASHLHWKHWKKAWAIPGAWISPTSEYYSIMNPDILGLHDVGLYCYLNRWRLALRRRVWLWCRQLPIRSPKTGFLGPADFFFGVGRSPIIGIM